MHTSNMIRDETYGTATKCQLVFVVLDHGFSYQDLHHDKMQDLTVWLTRFNGLLYLTDVKTQYII